MASVMGRRWQEIGKRIAVSAVCLILFLGLSGCARSSSPNSQAVDMPQGIFARGPNLEEVSPPDRIRQLRRTLDAQRSLSRRDPQVKIVGLKADETIDQTTASIRFDVEDFPIFKDPELALGPHLTVLLDDQPYADVYDAKQSIAFSDLKPGTHTIRVFASLPWHEIVKAPSAFDLVTFHVFAPTHTHRPTSDRPLLTYSQPHGEYGAEPILLDYLITSPSGESKGSEPAVSSGPKVQVTVNGKSFITEEQPPLYLKGFKSGANWVKVELLSPSGKAIPNDLSETVRLVTLNSGGSDALSRLVRGDLSVEDAEPMVSLEASQRRAAQKLEALSAPKPAPVLKAPEPTTEPKSDVSLPPIPSPSPVAIPEAPVPVKLPSPSLPKPQERIVPVPARKLEAVRVEPPAGELSSPSKGFDKDERKPVPAGENPIQSYLKRFRQPDIVSPTPQLPLPQQIEPTAGTGAFSKAESIKPAPTQPKFPTPSPVKPPVQPKVELPDVVRSGVESKEKSLPLEKTPALEKTSERPWRKFLNLEPGEDRDKPAVVESPEQSSLPSRYSKAIDLQSLQPSSGLEADSATIAKP
ncbi:hypothetical protein [Altericista sp. CCNU0014]|uniref:hypothetical protein n=1 Tax=Altericista sp. CCNU0014 TaxID=3082949 RepID=UPI00384DA7EF